MIIYRETGLKHFLQVAVVKSFDCNQGGWVHPNLASDVKGILSG